MTSSDTVPEIDLTDPDVMRDPFAAYGRAREQAPLARAGAPGFGPMWTVLRYADAKAMLGDPTFEIRTESFQRPDVPADCRPYLRTMAEMNGEEHLRQRRLVAPAFTPRRAAEFRPRIERIVADLLDALPDGDVDLLEYFARPLPMDVICALVGIPEEDRPAWRRYGATVAQGAGPDFVEAIPGIIAGAKAAVARRRASLGDDLVSDLVRSGAEDADIVRLIWHLVIAGQTPTNLIANSVAALLAHPDQLALLRTDPGMMPRAVEELIRFCGSVLLVVPRYARSDTSLCGTRIRAGEMVTASVAAANRDPRVFTSPDLLDVGRATVGHLGFAHGPHFCVGASLARVQTEVALTALLRVSGLGLVSAERALDPGTWRLESLVVAVSMP